MADDSQLDVVQHPTLGPLKFPKSMSPDERNQVIDRHMSDYNNTLTRETSAAAPGGKLPIAGQQFQRTEGEPFPSTNPVEAAGQRLDLLGKREQHAQQSITPVSNAISILEPITAARQIVGGKIGGYAGDKIKPGGVGELLGGLLGSMLAGSANEPDQMRRGAQDALGVGKNFIQSGAEKVGDTNVELVGKHVKQVETAQQANAESQAGFNQRQQHIDIATQHAQTISDRLPQVYDAARKEAGAAYGPQPKGTLDSAELKTAIEDAAQSKLAGNTKLPTAISKVIADIDKPPEPTLLDQASVFKGAGKAMRGQGKEFSGTGKVSADEALSSMDPKARQKFLASMSPEERANVEQPATAEENKVAPLDAKRIHGFMSELGKASRSGSLSGDEASAINATRAMLEGRLRKLYDNEGRLGDFQKGQAAWKQMANTFENQSPTAKGGSPVARALGTKDPVTGKLRTDYVRSILSDDKAFPVAQEQLGRYKHLGAPTNELDVMKTNGDFSETLPSKVKWRKEPDPPTLENFDPIEARKVALKQKSASLSGTGGPYGVMRDVMGMKGALTGNPMALSYPILRRILGGSVGNEGLIKWLSKATPEEMNMAKEIPASKVAAKRAKNP